MRWKPVLAAFEEQCTVYALDRRGRGESGDADEYDFDREVEDVVAVVDMTDDPVILLSHSFGALYSLEAALRTDNLRKLILYEPPLPVGDNDLAPEEVVADMGAFMETGEDERALVLFLEEIAGFSPAQADTLRSEPNWPARVAAAYTVLRETRAPDEYEFDATRFAELTTPTLLLSGSESSQNLKEALATVDAALPNSRVVRFEGHGHAAMNTAPEQFSGRCWRSYVSPTRKSVAVSPHHPGCRHKVARLAVRFGVLVHPKQIRRVIFGF